MVAAWASVGRADARWAPGLVAARPHPLRVSRSRGLAPEEVIWTWGWRPASWVLRFALLPGSLGKAAGQSAGLPAGNGKAGQGWTCVRHYLPAPGKGIFSSQALLLYLKLVTGCCPPLGPQRMEPFGISSPMLSCPPPQAPDCPDSPSFSMEQSWEFKGKMEL